MTEGSTVEVHHLLEGPEDAPVLVLSNSLGTTLAIWDEQAPALSERFRLLRYDHRGHGGSPVPPGPYKIEDLARDVLVLLDRLEVERFSFCGLSIGGMVGMWLVGEAPERFESLVLYFGPLRTRHVRFPCPDGPRGRCRCHRGCGGGALVHPRLPRGSPRGRRVGPAYAARDARRGLRGLLRGGSGC
jgi:pimeloyl-ACP methyl ester carboxylesterase